MGKQKRQRRKPRTRNPIGLPSTKESELNEEIVESSKKRVLQDAYDDVQSCNLEEKLSALQILASMSCDSTVAKQIANDGIAKIIGPLLMDRNTAIRVNTAYTLKEIVENGGQEAYIDLIKDDIMTPLTTLLKQCYSDWQPKGAGDEKETFVEAVGLLWRLCANNENAIKCANEKNLVSFLIKFVDIDIYGVEIVTVTMQCLVCLSDENEAAIKEIKQNESTFLSLLKWGLDDFIPKISFLKVLVGNLLINIINYTDNNQMDISCKVLSILSEILSIDNKFILSRLISVLPHESNASSCDKKKEIQEIRKMLSAHEQAIQVVANVFFEDNDSTIDSDTDDSETEIESECMDDDSMNDNLKMISTFPIELVEAINGCNLISIMWDKTELIDKDSQEILEQTPQGKAALKQFHDIHCAAYLCLNNLFSSMEVDALGGIDYLYMKWMDIGTVVFKGVILDNVELMEAATAAMRAIFQRLAEVRANIFEHLSINDVQPILNTTRQCYNANVRVNLIRMLCNLVQILMNNENVENREIIKSVSMFLLHISKTETQVWVIAESIDALMDIYAEDETDQLAADIELVPRLQSLIPHFKNKMRQQKKHLKNGKFVISTVNANLMRFVRYKQKQIGIFRQRSTSLNNCQLDLLESQGS